jgi:hypothetical protein
MLRCFGTAVLAACGSAPTEPGTGAADGRWPIVYEQRFADPSAVEGFVFSDPARARWTTAGGQPSLELFAESSYTPPFRSPKVIALVGDVEVADFDLEVELMQTGRDYNHRDLCLFFGFESPHQFYYAHLATTPDRNAHNLFRVANAPRAHLAPVAAAGVDWGRDEWHRVRIERRCGPGTIRVFWDGAAEPILTATDRTFAWGRVGFGSFDDSGRIANVVLRAPESRPVSGRRDPFAH